MADNDNESGFNPCLSAFLDSYFYGKIEFEVSIKVLGESVTRQAKAYYEYTPEWPYFDTEKGEEVEEGFSCALTLHVLAVPELEYAQPEDNEPHWEQLSDITARDVLAEDQWEAIYAAIDEDAKRQDEANRLKGK